LSGGPAAASGSDDALSPTAASYEDEKAAHANRSRNSARTGSATAPAWNTRDRRESRRASEFLARAGEIEEEQERIEPDRYPDLDERYGQRENRCRGESNEPGWPRRRKPSFSRVEGRDVPRLEYLNLRHHPISEERGRRKMGEPLERAHHLPSLRQLGATLRAVLDVRNKGGDAESGFAVQELVDFVG
jgi:hypothetical protein